MAWPVLLRTTSKQLGDHPETHRPTPRSRDATLVRTLRSVAHGDRRRLDLDRGRVHVGAVVDRRSSTPPTNAFVEVPYPPPPARVEFVTERPNREAVWIDGEWGWSGRRWAWEYGRWVVPPSSNVGYVRWFTVRRQDGVLLFSPGTWKDASGATIAAPPAAALAHAQEESVVSPDGNRELTAPNVVPGR